MTKEINLERIATANGKHPTFTSPYDAGKKYPILTAGYALQSRPPIKWIVEDLFQPQSLAMLVGQYGTGKTFAAVDLGVCVALGTPWLSRETSRCNVLIIDEESGERRLADRMGMGLRGHGADAKTPISAISFAGFDLLTDKGILDLEAVIEHTRAGFVIVDALVDILPGVDENSVQEMLPALKVLREIAERTSCCILLLHHTNKSGEYRGSTAIAAKVDVLLKLVREKDSDLLRFEFTKARDVEARDLAARMRFDSDNCFCLDPQDARAITPKLTQPQRYVMRFLQEHGGQATRQDIAAAPDTCTSSSALKAVHQLAEMGLIKRVDGGGPGERSTFAVVLNE